MALPSADPWNDALELTRLGGRWSQHLFSVLGRRKGQLVEVHVLQTYDPTQDPGAKGYLNDDEVDWRIEAVCFPLGPLPPERFALIGNTLIGAGRFCLDLPSEHLSWAVSNFDDEEGASLMAEGYVMPWREPKPPEARLRFTVKRANSATPCGGHCWTEAPAGVPAEQSRHWRRWVGDHLIEVELLVTGDPPVLPSLHNDLLDSFWVAS